MCSVKIPLDCWNFSYHKIWIKHWVFRIFHAKSKDMSRLSALRSPNFPGMHCGIVRCRMPYVPLPFCISKCYCTFQDALCPYRPACACCGEIAALLCVWAEECNAYWCCEGGWWPREELAGHVFWLAHRGPGGHTAERDGEGGMGGIWVVMERGLGLEWGVKSSTRDEERWRALWTRKKGEGWLRRKRVIEATSSRSNGSCSSISSGWEGKGEGGMLVPGAAHLGGSARTGEGRGSVLTIYVYMRIRPRSCRANITKYGIPHSKKQTSQF